MASARFFSTPVEAATEEEKPKSNFMDFLKKGEETDAKVAEQDQPAEAEAAGVPDIDEMQSLSQIAAMI